MLLTQPAPASAPSTATALQIPILILNVHSSCNCRCLMCDIWQNRSATSLRPVDLARHRESLARLGVRHVVFTGGEPLLNTDLPALSAFLRELNIRITLLSTGLLLKKRAHELASIADDIIVSLDGPLPVHDRIRRVPGAFNLLAEGVVAAREAAPHIRISARCTVQKANHLHLTEVVTAAQRIGLHSISFLAADVTSTAFNRDLLWPLPRQNQIALTSSEADALDHELNRLSATHADAFSSGFIAESPAKLRRIALSFRAQLGQEPAQSPLCNAPWISAVLELNGDVRPCFFHPPIGNLNNCSFEEVLDGPEAIRFRSTLDVETNPTCRRCVCALHLPASNSSSAPGT